MMEIKNYFYEKYDDKKDIILRIFHVYMEWYMSFRFNKSGFIDSTYGKLDDICQKHSEISKDEIQGYFKDLKKILDNYDSTINDKYNKIKNIINNDNETDNPIQKQIKSSISIEPKSEIQESNTEIKHTKKGPKKQNRKIYETPETGIHHKPYSKFCESYNEISDITNKEDIEKILKLYREYSLNDIQKYFYPKYSVSELKKCICNNKNFSKLTNRNDIIEKIKSYNGTKTVKELCEILNMPNNTVRKIIENHKLSYKRIGKSNISTVEKIKSYNGTKTVKELCEILNMSENTIRTAISRYKLSYKRIGKSNISTVEKIKSYNGTKTVKELCEILNIPKDSIRNIIKNHKLPYKRSNNSTISTAEKIKSYNGTKTVKELCEILNIPENTIRNIIKDHKLLYKRINKPDISTAEKIKSYNGIKTVKELCEILNMSETTIRNAISRHKLSYKRITNRNKESNIFPIAIDDDKDKSKYYIKFFVNEYLIKTNKQADVISIADMRELFNTYKDMFKIEYNNTHLIGDLQTVGELKMNPKFTNFICVKKKDNVE